MVHVCTLACSHKQPGIHITGGPGVVFKSTVYTLGDDMKWCNYTPMHAQLNMGSVLCTCASTSFEDIIVVAGHGGEGMGEWLVVVSRSVDCSHAAVLHLARDLWFACKVLAHSVHTNREFTLHWMWCW